MLKTVDYILAEDKRQSAKLLSHYQIKTPMLSYHEFSDEKQTAHILSLLRGGKQLALISDAGTPLISDPGYKLVRAVKAEGMSVVPVPGVSAVITALSASGLATDRFSFEGFLPAKEKARQDVLAMLKSETRTLVFYEAPHRIRATVADIVSVLGASRMLCMARELTKTFETIRQLPAAEMLAWIDGDSNQQRGEIVLLLEGEQKVVVAELSDDAMRLASSLLAYLPPKDVSKIVADYFELNKKQVYNYLLSLK